MQVRKRNSLNLVGATLACAVFPAVLAADDLRDWPAMMDAELGQLRGGFEFESLIANFAIERIVRIDGEVVARTLLVFDFTNVEAGRLPSLQVIGDLANLIQVGPGNAAAGIEQQVVASVAAAVADATEAQSAAGAGAAAIIDAANQSAGTLSLPAGADASASTVTAASGVSSGSATQFGTALNQAIEVATSLDSAAGSPAAEPAPAPMTPLTPMQSSPATPALPASVADVALPQPAAAAPQVALEPTAPMPAASPAPSALPAASSLVRIVGSTGQVVVVSNLPDAAALATAIQNSAAATRLETQTTISATLNSLALLQSGAMADALRQQILRSLGP